MMTAGGIPGNDFRTGHEILIFRGAGGRNLQQDVLQLEHHAWRNGAACVVAGGIERDLSSRGLKVSH